MLAFNLGVFFRNLRGEDVVFSARNEQCEMLFSGGVVNLSEQTDLTRHLAVTLGDGELSMHIEFEENEDEEAENMEVEVSLVQQREGDETVLVRTTFLFGEISLKPRSELDEKGPQPPEAG